MTVWSSKTSRTAARSTASRYGLTLLGLDLAYQEGRQLGVVNKTVGCPAWFIATWAVVKLGYMSEPTDHARAIWKGSSKILGDFHDLLTYRFGVNDNRLFRTLNEKFGVGLEGRAAIEATLTMLDQADDPRKLREAVAAALVGWLKGLPHDF